MKRAISRVQARVEQRRALVPGNGPPSRRKKASPTNSSQKELEDELTATREHLQTLVEELKTSNEEMQALNEEIQASNEELQSSNE